jgi:amino acid adenylation domain-containing protein/non-ribosomal peptide synthase protein (TIGR01720 family)
VGLCVDRTVDLAVGVLGVLASGAAYVPLDPAHPEERLRYQVSDAGVRGVVTGGEASGGLPSELGAGVARWPVSGSGEAREELPRVPSSGAAYVIYTSGSTGRPKGVVVGHGEVARLFGASEDRFGGFGSGDTWSLFHSYAFDFSVWELWGALLYGGRLVMVPYWVSRSPESTWELVCRERVTVLSQTPSAFRPLSVQAASEGGGSSLRWVVFGGEALEPSTLARWWSGPGTGTRGPGLMNMYGITETTVHVTWRPMAASDAGGASRIGWSLDDLWVYVTDRRLRPVPVGVAGELVVGGAGVSRGYLGRPGLTAQRFVPDAWSGEAGSRLYRSGDLGRWVRVPAAQGRAGLAAGVGSRGGELEYLGRIDHQVKVRGFRIELGEIEAVLAGHPGVAEAVVSAREVPGTESGERRLVAWVVPREGAAAAPGVESLRAHLGRSLPEHMVPAAFVVLEALPLTANGKVDRRALPEPEGERPELASAYAPPRTPAEAALAEVWAEVLGVERVGVHDNFFTLGGDSILSLRVVAKAAVAGWKVRPREIFEARDLAALAGGAITADGARTEAVEAGGVPLTPIQRWFFERPVPDRHHWNQSLLLRLRDGADTSGLSATVAALGRRHDAFRLRFDEAGGEWRQTLLADAGPVPCHRIDLSRLPDERFREALESSAAQAQSSLDLQRGPLNRVALFEAGGGRGARLLLVVHHLAVDAVSWRVLLEEIALTLGGPEVEPPPATTPFATWARRLEQHARDAGVEDELLYWRAVCRGTATVLPGRAPDARDHAGAAASVELSLDPETTEALRKEVARAYGATLQEALLTALGDGLGRWPGRAPADRRAFLVALEGHGREEALVAGADLSRTVGWFTSLFPFRLDAVGDGNGPEAHGEQMGAELRRVKERLRAVPHGGVGWGLWACSGREESAGLPAPAVAFNYLGRLDGVVDSGAPFSPSAESAGPTQSPEVERPHALEVVGGIREGRLGLSFIYGSEVFRRQPVQDLADACGRALGSLAEHCRRLPVPVRSPSDFPLVALDQETLDRVCLAVGGGRDAVEIEDLYPLVPLQEGLLVECLARPRPWLYFEQLGFRLRGRLDTEAFRTAWTRVVERHPALRTSFVWEGLERPLQAVHARVEVPWRLEDRRSPPADEEIARLMVDDRARGFDLREAPLLRFTLARLADDRWFFLWSHHHLLLDGWCLSLVIEEVFALYREATGGGAAALPERRPYRDLVAWLEERDQEGVEEFWRERLAGLEEPTPLLAALGGRAGAPQDPDGAPEQVVDELLVPAATTAALDALCRSRRITVGTLVHGAWAALLARLTGRSRVLFGTVVSGRPPDLPGADTMVGLFINTLPVRVEVPPERPVGDWLEGLQGELAELRDHEHDPLVEIQRWSGLGRGAPLFETLLAFENYQRAPATSRRDLGVELEEARIFEATSYPLTLAVGPGERLLLRLESQPSALEPPSAARLLRHLRTLVAGIARSPELPVAELPLLDPAETAQVLGEWGTSPPPPEPEDDLFARVAAVAAERPSAAAVISTDGVLAFADLVERAEKVAYRLRASGVGPESLVGVCVPRSPDLAVALLAVLAAGGAYLPLDPAYPTDRLAWMARDAGVGWLLCAEPEGVAALAAECGVPSIPLAGCGDGPRLRSLEPGASLPLGRAATVLYTSGSTGTPKGVVTSHEALVGYALDLAGRLGLGSGDRVLQFAPMSFDVLAEELFPAWLSGAAVVFSDPLELGTCAGLQDAVERFGITLVELPAAFWHEWARPGRGRCATARLPAPDAGGLRSSGARAGGLVARHGERPGGRLRPDRDHGDQHPVLRRRGRGVAGAAHRAPDGGSSGRPGRPLGDAGATRCLGRADPGRPGPRPGVPRAPGAQRRALRSRPVRGGTGIARLSHRRPGPLARRWPPRVPWPHGRPGQGPRVPGGAR